MTSALLISIEPSVMVHMPMLISLSWLLDQNNSLFQPWTSMPGCFSLDVCHKKSSKGCGAELWQTILDCVWSMYMLNGERYLTIPCWETRSDICLLLDSSPFITPRGYPRERSQRRGLPVSQVAPLNARLTKLGICCPLYTKHIKVHQKFTLSFMSSTFISHNWLYLIIF